MLNYLLVWIVGLGSLGLYLSRFWLPEVSRKYDLIWSGVGLIYALDLLADHNRIKGGLLLGQMASVALIVWFGWQALQQRRQLTPPEDQTALPNSVDAVLPFLQQGWARLLAAYQQGSQDLNSRLEPLTDATATSPSASTALTEEDWDEATEPEPLAEGSNPVEVVGELEHESESFEQVASTEPQPPEPEALVESNAESQPPELAVADIPNAEPQAAEPDEEGGTAEADEVVPEPMAIATPEQPLPPASATTTVVAETPVEPSEVEISPEAPTQNIPESIADRVVPIETEATTTPEHESEILPEEGISEPEMEEEAPVDTEVAEAASSQDARAEDDGWPPQEPIT